MKKYTKAFYSPQEVAELAGVTSATIMNYIAAGNLYAVKLSERTYRIPVRAVAKMLTPELLAPSTWTEDLETDVEAELAEEIAFLENQEILPPSLKKAYA